MEMETDSFCLALAEKKLYDCIQPDKKAIWEKMRKNDCRDSFKADAKSMTTSHKKPDKFKFSGKGLSK